MGLWPRVLVLAVVAVVVALLLKFAHPVLVLIVFVAGLTAAGVTARRRVRAPERSAGTELLGLRRETTDPFGIVAFPVSLFGRVGDPRIEDLVWGRWRALDVHSFALSFLAPTGTEESSGRPTLACAMAKLDHEVPGLVVEPQTLLPAIGSPPPGVHVKLGDAGLDEAMNVWGEDDAVAREILDAPAIDWLRGLDERWAVEVRGRIAMVYGPRPDRPDLIATLETLGDLVARLPKDRTGSLPPAV